MQVNVQQLSPVLVEFQVEVPADRVKTEVDKAYQTLQKTARVKGFRPGKAPRDILTHLFGDRITLDVTSASSTTRSTRRCPRRMFSRSRSPTSSRRSSPRVPTSRTRPVSRFAPRSPPSSTTGSK